MRTHPLAAVLLTLVSGGGEDDSYVPLLKKTLESAIFLSMISKFFFFYLNFSHFGLLCDADKYFQFFQDSNNTKGLATIKTLGDFLNQTLLMFVIADLHLMCERYIKKGKDDFFG